jgi:hypothetical protein
MKNKIFKISDHIIKLCSDGPAALPYICTSKEGNY